MGRLEGKITIVSGATSGIGRRTVELFVAEGAKVVAESMRQTVARLLASQLQMEELSAPITFSAGIIRIRDYLTVAEATDLADTLLYHVKQHGKHNIAYYQGQEIRLIRDSGTNPVT